MLSQRMKHTRQVRRPSPGRSGEVRVRTVVRIMRDRGSLFRESHTIGMEK